MIDLETAYDQALTMLREKEVKCIFCETQQDLLRFIFSNPDAGIMFAFGICPCCYSKITHEDIAMRLDEIINSRHEYKPH